jgi:ribose transport system ATP-binding protein
VTDATPRDDVLLRARGIGKAFFGVHVLSGIDLDLRRGEVHALVGENGAGKSTFMKILAGVHAADTGTVEFEGREVAYAHPRQAMDAGLVTVFQEFTLLPERTVAQNVFLGREPRRAGFVDRAAMASRTRALLDELGVGFIDPAARVGSLTVAEQQIVEIVKALSFDARVISMDEPTAALSDHEVALLYAIVRRLTARGVAVLYVSHRLKEIFELCDRITILKDGRLVSTDDTADLTPDELVRRMVGRPIQSYFPGRCRAPSGARCSSSSTAAATSSWTASASPSTPVRSSVSRACRVRGAPSWSKGCSASSPSSAERCGSRADPPPYAAPARPCARGSPS